MEIENFSPEATATPENETPNPLIDLSGLEPWFVHQQIEHILPLATRMVVFPDLGPTEKGIVPTGSITEIDTKKHPDWLKLVSGADMGCGMLFATLNTKTKDFQKDQDSLDRLRDAIKFDKSITLGRGNHFIDFVENDEHQVSVVIHTGAFKDMQRKLTKIVKSAIKNGDWETASAAYLEEYQKVIESANNNRQAILKLISEVYGEVQIQYHEAHNTIEIDSDQHTATIYKGVVHVKDTTKRQLLPSSMGDLMDFYLPGPTVGEGSLFGAPHGTGRNKSRSDMKALEDLSQIDFNLMLPTGGEIPKTELPQAYRASNKTEEIMLNNGLMILNKLSDIQQFRVIAYIGHI